MSSIDAYTTPIRVQSWVLPAASAAIVVEAIVSVSLCIILGEGGGGDGFLGTLFALVLLALAISEVVVMRFFMLPAILTNAQTAEAATPQGVVDAMALLSLAFANATAIYGMVIAAFTANLLYVTPFPVLAAITLFVLLSFVYASADELKTTASLEGVT